MAGGKFPQMLEAGKIVLCIDKRYPLAEVAEVMRYLGAGRARGKVIITVAGEER